MKNYAFCLLFILSCPVFAQKEASNWYFGRGAGLHFSDDGAVIPLAGGQMNTNEGCSSISDAEGNLLFYTDGRSVWDRNHVLMPNGNYFSGTGLLGDPSSSQSAIIIPKKNDPNIYYIFTVDEPHHLNASVYPDQFTGQYSNTESVPNNDDGFNNGLNFSVVDLSLTGANGSIGDITTRNIQLYTYNPDIREEAKYKCSEKVTAVKDANGTGFWVVTQFINKFYSFYVGQEGVNQEPVITQINPLVPVSGYRRNAIGCIKASPNGKKIAIAHQQLGTAEGETDNNGVVYLYDFDNATGVVSNARLIKDNIGPYGLEFSPSVSKLYVSYDERENLGRVVQYNLISADIPASEILLSSNQSSTTLQLGPNGKIYRAVNGMNAIDVINNPDADGALCDYQSTEIPLPDGTISIFGLPPFVTSLFAASIVATGNCQGTPTDFRLQVSNAYDSVVWDFGDGTPTSAEDAPQHLYTSAGAFNVVATITRGREREPIAKLITISIMPVINEVPALVECDTDQDGFASFNLNDAAVGVLGTQNTDNFLIRYFASQDDAAALLRPLDSESYMNVSNPQTVYARLENKDNANCFVVTSFQLIIGSAGALGSTTFAVCDDAQDGDDANGQANFNLDIVKAQLVPVAGFTTTFYNSNDAAQNGDATAMISQIFYNTTPGSQTIYAKVSDDAFPACTVIIPVTLKVNALPLNNVNAVLVQCDTGSNPDGITSFNLDQANGQYNNGDTNTIVAYYSSENDAESGVNPITGSFRNSSNPQQVFAKVSNALTGCFRVLPLTLQVSTNTVAPLNLARCDDDGTEDGLAEFDLESLGLQTPSNTVVYYETEEDALLEQNPQSANYVTTVPNRQNIFARIETNNDCTALQEIELNVYPLPNVEVAANDVVCLNTQDYITLDAGVRGSNIKYEWSTGAETATISINQPGVYTVSVTDITFPDTPCSKLRTITVLPSNIAVIKSVIVEDLRDINTITVIVSPAGGVNTTYLYSLDKPNGPWQAEPFFNDVDAGIHTLYVYDSQGCGTVRQQVAVLSIPKYFTPNGDMVNDYWKITGLNGAAFYNSRLFIYDRYGKLLSDVDRNGPGWDGTFNGQPLPGTDYWYVLTLPDGRVVKGHFSLLR
jgi:gliding motility-associated-like protein